MSTPLIEDEGPVTPPPDATFDGTQVANGGIEINEGAKIVLDPSLYVLADTYTLIDYANSQMTLISSSGTPVPTNAANLNSFLTVDGSQLVGLAISAVTLNELSGKVFVTLVAA